MNAKDRIAALAQAHGLLGSVASEAMLKGMLADMVEAVGAMWTFANEHDEPEVAAKAREWTDLYFVLSVRGDDVATRAMAGASDDAEENALGARLLEMGAELIGLGQEVMARVSGDEVLVHQNPAPTWGDNVPDRVKRRAAEREEEKRRRP